MLIPISDVRLPAIDPFWIVSNNATFGFVAGPSASCADLELATMILSTLPHYTNQRYPFTIGSSIYTPRPYLNKHQIPPLQAS